jgi:hypothetical protein
MTQNIEQLLRKSRAIISLQGREYVTFRGLLYVAHESGLESIDVELVSWDAETRSAICRATVKGARGTFSDIGDASPANVNKMIANACLRMSSTRSQSRALRSYLGIGITSVEELPGDAPKEPPAPATKASTKKTSTKKTEPFDFAAAAAWAVKVGAFKTVEEAEKEARVTLGGGTLTNGQRRSMWRKRCEGGKG